MTMTVVGLLVFLGMFLGMIFVIVPLSNEDHLLTRLNPAFEEFKLVTTARYPDKVEREAAFAKVLAEKDRVVRDSAWPLIACRATFTARNPGTIHRKDVRSVSCFWGGLYE